MTQQLNGSGVTPVFFSDGSADIPQHPELTKAAWSLIMYKGKYQDGVENFSKSSGSLSSFQTQFLVAALAPCHGSQNINRAELSALVFLHENWTSSILITDSSYTIDSWNLVNTVNSIYSLAFKPNSDLLQRLFLLKANRNNHVVFKVRSHQWDGGECNGEIRFHVVGNEFADHAAKRANRELNHDMICSLATDSSMVLHEWQQRKQHYLMLTELHANQTTMTANRNLGEALQADEPFASHLGTSIYDVLGRYTTNNFFQIVVDWPKEVSLISEWTSEVASSLLQFWGELRWPDTPTTELERLGISWTEICLSFLIDRNLGIPTPVPGTGQKLRDLTLLKEGGHGFFLVVKSFYWLSSWLNRQLQGSLFKPLHRGMTKSMQKLGSTNQTNGFLSRPIIPAQPLVIEVIKRYRKNFGRFAGMNSWPEMPINGQFSQSFWYHLQVPDSD